MFKNEYIGRHRLTEVAMRPRKVQRLAGLVLLGAIGAAAAVFITAPHAESFPGQCGHGYAVGSGGGFCDGPAAADGTWMHCETVYVLGFGGTNCFRVRPVSTDVDPRGWVPA